MLALKLCDINGYQQSPMTAANSGSQKKHSCKPTTQHINNRE